MWRPMLQLILVRQKILLKIGLMTVTRGGLIRNMAILRRMLIYLCHHIIWVHFHSSFCLMNFSWRSRQILKICYKILRSFSHFRKMLWCLNLIHTFCISRIHELFLVIKPTHIHLFVLELFMILIIVILKELILVIRHTVLVLRLAPEKRRILIIC